MNDLVKRSGRGASTFRVTDIDTDRIIPARFLKCVTFDELGPALFYDERFDTQDVSKGAYIGCASPSRRQRYDLGRQFRLWVESRACAASTAEIWVRGGHCRKFRGNFSGQLYDPGHALFGHGQRRRDRALAALVGRHPDAEFLIDLAAANPHLRQ